MSAAFEMPFGSSYGYFCVSRIPRLCLGTGAYKHKAGTKHTNSEVLSKGWEAPSFTKPSHVFAQTLDNSFVCGFCFRRCVTAGSQTEPRNRGNMTMDKNQYTNVANLGFDRASVPKPCRNQGSHSLCRVFVLALPIFLLSLGSVWVTRFGKPNGKLSRSISNKSPNPSPALRIPV